jgi:hypothetical protein
MMALLPTHPFSKAEEAFFSILEILTKEAERKGPSTPSDQIVIADIGPSSMWYGSVLDAWAHRRSSSARILAIDPYFLQPDHAFFPDIDEFSSFKPVSTIEKIACEVETSLPEINARGVGRIDLLTMFNPYPAMPLPRVQSLVSIAADAPIIGALDGPSMISKLRESLTPAGYETAFLQNSFKKHFGGALYEFNPLYVAVRDHTK